MPGAGSTIAGHAVGFAAHLAHHGDEVALTDDHQTLTYVELEARAADVTSALGRTRRLVLLEAANTVPAIVAYLGALRGGHAVLLTTADDPEQSRRLAECYDPDVVCAAEATWSLDERRPGSVHTLHDDLAVLLSTSGSTGSSKLVRLSHANVQSNAEAIAGYLRLTPADRAVTSLPMHYCYGLSVINSYLTAGARIVLNDDSVADARFWDRVRREAVTSIAGVPYTFELLDCAGFAAMSLPSLRYLTQAACRPRRCAATRRWDVSGVGSCS
jgi:acyl-CoA synthetase (AMP-forming)/AMP-acid ligase II